MKRFFKDYKFIITIILGVLGILGLNAMVGFGSKSAQILQWTNALLNKYSGLLLLSQIGLTLYLVHKLLVITKQLSLLTPKTLTIVSDEETLFVGSSTNKALPTYVNAVPTQTGWWKESDRKYPQLRKATWIADRPTITNEEALLGGQYTFVREFEVPFRLNKMRSAKIFLVVDDSCELAVNATRFPKVSGYIELHKFDITKAVKQGTNRVQFLIENVPGEQWDTKTNKEFWESKDKFLWNPYGFKYQIKIEYLP